MLLAVAKFSSSDVAPAAVCSEIAKAGKGGCFCRMAIASLSALRPLLVLIGFSPGNLSQMPS